MRITHLFFSVSLIVSLLVAAPGFSQQIYVADSFKITLRTGPGTDHKILKMLPSGTRLQVMDQTSGWYKVKTPENNEGWVLKRYTMRDTPNKLKVQTLTSQLDRLKSANQEAESSITDLRAENKQLSSTLSAVQNELSDLKKRYASLKSDASQALEYKENLQATQEELGTTQSRLKTVSAENEELRSNQNMHWFLAGAGVVCGSALFGFFLGRVQRRKSKKVYF